jgi:hypothetical protein
MKTCYLYSFILPVEERFRDIKENEPLVSIPVALKDGRVWEAAILGVPHTIKATRISIPGVANETIDPVDFRRAVRLGSYMLDCIRLIYDPNAEYLYHGDGAWVAWNFVDPNDGPDFAIDIKQPLNPDYRVNTEGLKHLLGAEPKMRLIIHLMADSAKTTLPIQFRFLSCYKIIEMHHRVTANNRFSALALPFIPEFHAVYPDVSSVAHLCKRLSELRNRCAHIRLVSGGLGFSNMEADADDLFKIMPVLKKMVTRCLSFEYPNSSLRFSASPEELATQMAEMEAAGQTPVRVL